MTPNHPHMSAFFPGASLREVVAAASYGHSAFNPSIAFSPKEGYRLLVRDSNYLTTPDCNYVMNDPDGVIRTVTHLCVLDSELNVVAMEPIDERRVEHVEWSMVRGMEDARLFWDPYHNRWHRYGTIREHHWSGQCQVAEDWLDGTTVIHRVIHDGPEGLARTEKNWPALEGSPRDYVYTFGPSQVILTKVDGKNPTLMRAPWEVRAEAEGFRGGSPMIWHDGGYWGVIHEVTWHPHPREYWHRFVRCDQNGFLTHFTPAFYFFEPGIEFAAGLVVHGSDFVASFGYKDNRCFYARVPIREVGGALLDAHV